MPLMTKADITGLDLGQLATTQSGFLPRPMGHAVEPRSEHIQNVTEHLRILPACPRRHMKGMIGIRKQLQRCTPAEFFAKRLKLIPRRQFIAGALQEQHRDLNVKQMLGGVLRRAASRMKRKAKECQSTHAWQRSFRLDL